MNIKKCRRSGQYIVKQDDSWVKASSVIETKKSIGNNTSNSRRRLALISTKNFTKKGIDDEEDLPCGTKTIEFN